MQTPQFAACLFDMDGTLIDTEPYWLQAELDLVGEFSGQWSHEQGLALVGSGLHNSARAIQAAGVPLTEDEIISRLSGDVRAKMLTKMPWRPGARELVAELREAKVPCALVTMSFRDNANTLAEALTAEMGRVAFDVVVSGEDVSEPKPHPEAYLHAAALLGVDPHQCVAFEDSAFGAASAFSAGVFTIGVPLYIDIPSAYTHTRWESLENRGLADIHLALEAGDQS